ncbi:unnamed protein product [Adineta ricciae]|uniref:Solute carrier family 40 protein n=1 Tax=Adineta ricciae TaxID=249248 RepID=A0A813WYB9_ADIRI|nr:unnamed protein product [Adineta ricciae]CAF0917141.1 unnamed protein product [Adineta ricciae]
MGKGSHNTRIEKHEEQQIDASSPHRLPTLSEIKVKIPSHCFRPTVRESMTYVVKDVIYVALAFLVMWQIQKNFQFGFLLFPLYWYIQGTLYTSLFVLGHDCGHGSFSFYPLLNDIVGTILHTWILAPYYTWKLTHNHHHKNTNNIDKDEVFYPHRGEPYEPSISDDIFFWFPGIGWFYYIVYGYAPRTVSHFNPFQPIFYDRHFFGVCSSLAAYLGMCYLMYLHACTYGFVTLFVYHLIPVCIFASYMVIITMLHHTEIDVPWYADSEWNNVKGQLSTVDRHYGYAHSIIHSIGTHQIHHLFTKVPHYHLEEATEHFRRTFPELVRFHDEPVLSAFARMCKIFLAQRSMAEDNKMTDNQLAEIEIIDKTKSKYDKTKIYLYIAMTLSSWGDRMWHFAVGIYFISLNPTNLQGVAVNGVVLNLAVILFGTVIGVWIDRNPRLPTLRKILVIQNLSVALMAVLVVIALYDQSSISGGWIILIQGLLIAIGIIATLSSMASKISISRDWVVALYGSNRDNLASTNATLRRIDLISNVLAPVATGAVMTFTHRWFSAVFIACWNVISLVFEWLLYTKVYRSAEDRLSTKDSLKTSNQKSSGAEENAIRKMFSSIQGLGTYSSLSVCLPGLSLALLYMTVLSFDSVTRAYVIEEGLSEVVLGILNAAGSIIGVIGTFMYPVFVKRTGLVRTGVIGFWSEFSMLILCLLSLFVHGSTFIPYQKYFPDACFSGRRADSLHSINLIPYYCSKLNFSVLLLIAGITLNRFGLWIADLTVNQLQQERVPEEIRGRIGGTQNSLNQFFDMLRYILIIILPEMSQFSYHICLSVLSVFTASLIYTIWSCSRSSQLVPPSADVEMCETNLESSKTISNEKLDNDNDGIN